MKKLTLFFSLLAVSSLLAGESLTVCSFNIKWIGLYREKENALLAAVVRSNDIVVVQELLSPPYPGTFPDGTPYRPDRESTGFFDAMRAQGFAYVLSEEDTGAISVNHNNGSATEWFVTFYRTNAISPAPDLPHGFLADDRSANPTFDRVPYAFGFRSRDKTMDFFDFRTFESFSRNRRQGPAQEGAGRYQVMDQQPTWKRERLYYSR